MAVDVSKIRVAVTGAMSKGLVSATAPTGTAATLTGFTDLGGISEDGVTLKLPGAGETKSIKIWQNGAKVRTVRTPSEDNPTFGLVLVETSLATIETYFDVTVTQTATEGSFEYVVKNRSASAYVLDVIDGSELIRAYAPQGVVSEVSEVKLTNSDAIGWGITLDAEFSAAKGYNFKTWMTALKS